MPLLSRSELNSLVGQEYRSVSFSKALTQSARLAIADSTKTYDIFLSHSFLDQEPVWQLNYYLEAKLGLDVYVDWIENPELNRANVSPETASELRNAMDRCRSLVYAYSENSSESKWMQWELGYSDAKHGRIAILQMPESPRPVSARKTLAFLGLYPYIDIEDTKGGARHLWVNHPLDSNRYSNIMDWQQTGDLPVHTP